MIEDTHNEKNAPDADRAPAAGFWRRTAAFAIDGIVLGLIGMAVIALGFEWLTRIGAWGRLIGFAFGSLYFTLLEGVNRRCQSLGKQALKIKVVRLSPDGFVPLTPIQAWLRYAIIAVPFILGGMGFVDTSAMRHGPSWLAIVNSEVVFLWGAAIVYLLVFNRPSRRSLHDMAVSAAVVRVAAHASPQAPVRRVHWIAMSVVGTLLVAGGLVARHRFDDALAGMLGIQQAVADVPGVRESGVASMHRVKGTSGTDAQTIITAVVATPALQTEEGALEIVRAAFTATPMLATRDAVTVVIVRSADVGVATWRQQMTASLPGPEWATRLKAHPRP
jgi:uncharacterized RDD family membrane protein YckC